MTQSGDQGGAGVQMPAAAMAVAVEATVARAVVEPTHRPLRSAFFMVYS